MQGPKCSDLHSISPKISHLPKGQSKGATFDYPFQNTPPRRRATLVEWSADPLTQAGRACRAGFGGAAALHRPSPDVCGGCRGGSRGCGEPPSTVDVFYHHIGSFRLCCSRVGGPVAGPGPPVARLSVLRLKRAPHPIASRADSIGSLKASLRRARAPHVAILFKNRTQPAPDGVEIGRWRWPVRGCGGRTHIRHTAACVPDPIRSVEQ